MPLLACFVLGMVRCIVPNWVKFITIFGSATLEGMYFSTRQKTSSKEEQQSVEKIVRPFSSNWCCPLLLCLKIVLILWASVDSVIWSPPPPPFHLFIYTCILQLCGWCSSTTAEVPLAVKTTAVVMLELTWVFSLLLWNTLPFRDGQQDWVNELYSGRKRVGTPWVMGIVGLLVGGD